MNVKSRHTNSEILKTNYKKIKQNSSNFQNFSLFHIRNIIKKTKPIYTFL